LFAAYVRYQTEQGFKDATFADFLVEEANVVGLGIFDRVSDRGEIYLALPESSG
jgi:hypothetical protein